MEREKFANNEPLRFNKLVEEACFELLTIANESERVSI